MEVTAQECWLVMSFPLPFSSKLTCVDIHRWFPFHETLIFSFFFFLWFKGLLRCGKSCRLRWINYLRADLKRGNITAEEEEIIIKLHASLGNRLVCLCLSCSYWNITCMWKMWYREALVCIGTGAPWKLECEAKKCIVEFSLSLSLCSYKLKRWCVMRQNTLKFSTFWTEIFFFSLWVFFFLP